MADADELVELKHPITVTIKGNDGERQEQIAEVRLRRIKAKDMRAMDAQPGEFGKLLALIARVAGITVAQADELDAEDIAAIGAKLEAFIPPGLLTGETP